MPDPVPARAAPSAAAARLTPDRLRDWVREAKPGARLVYARGACFVLHAAPGVGEAVRALYDAGWVRMHLTRPDPLSPLEYLVVRTGKPVLKGSVL